MLEVLWNLGAPPLGFTASRAQARQWESFPLGAVSVKGLKERPSKGPLGLYRGFMRLYKGYIWLYRVLGLGVPSWGPSYCPLKETRGGRGFLLS